MKEVASTSAQESAQHTLEEWTRIAAERSGSVLLRTARADTENQRSFLFTDPVQILFAERVDEIPVVFAAIQSALQAGNYIAGFLSYEAGYQFEPAALRSASIPVSIQGTSDLPLMWFGVYRAPLVRNELECADAELGQSCETAQQAEEVSIGMSRTEYCERIEQIRRYIEAGDFYQANFTVRMRQPWRRSAGELFEKIMRNQPVPYGALINTGDSHILSASPELFFRKRDRQIVVRPMKGTARRGHDLAEDAQIAAWLAADEKNCAENVMIVDLLRNDLGRICEAGSVAVTELFAVERYPDLLQMTSTVQGELRPETSYYEIFRSLFPCGSITGAPKVRTMQVIHEQERELRGVACGAIGYFSPAGDSIFSVAIRTLTLRNGEVQLRVGSGITYDSDPEAEYEECLLKSQFLTRTPQQFELIETMAWDGDFLFLDLHLQRLRASAEYFDFRFAEEDIRGQLHRFAENLARGTRHRVRLLLSRSGATSISSAPLAPVRRPAMLVVASERTDSSDVFLRHKTTRRAVYDRAFAQAQAAGYDDVLFLNERGEVTECTIHNVMVARGEKFIMPPLRCGLLPGVYRQHLLTTHPEIEEAVIALEDVRSTDRIFIFNSVRGLRTARIANGLPVS